MPTVPSSKLSILRELKEEAEEELESLRRRRQVLKRYIAHLDEQIQRQLDAREDSIANKIASVLRKANEPMRAKDISEALETAGVTTKSPKGLLPVVIADLARRVDLFVRTDRGTYMLVEAKSKNN